MKPIIEKILASGLIDQHLTKLLETWGYLPEGSVEKVKEDALKTATRGHLVRLAEDLAEEFEDTEIKETPFHLIFGYPTKVSVRRKHQDAVFGIYAVDVPAVVDKMGRFVFRIGDAQEEWFIPGYQLVESKDGIEDSDLWPIYQILSHKILYHAETPIAVEVTAVRVLTHEMD